MRTVAAPGQDGSVMNTWRHPNSRLRYVLAEAGWTEQELATAVNAAGAEIGTRLSYDRTTVAHWLSGTRPRPPTPDLLAEVFSRRLARQVTAAELGLAAESPDGAGSASRRPRNGDIGSVLIHLHTSAKPRAASMPAYSLADLEVPGWPEAADVSQARRFTGRRPVTVADMDAAEHLARVLAADDAAFGGGHVRRATAAYLAADLAPKLYSRMSAATRRRLFAVATQLSYLCGFMCFDDQLHGLSQRYYRTALRLAAENGDQAGYVIAMRAMSVQAYSLGHRRHARNLAETAASGARRIGPRRQAFLYGQLAVARAVDGDRAGALASMADAERRLDQATSASQLTGAYHLASLAHQQAVVRDLLGDRHGAITALDASIRHRPDDERRSRAITLALLADLQLSAGYLDEAVSTWHLFLDDYPYLDSGRATAELRRLRSRVRPLTRNAMARTLLQRASAYT
jgi:transcriptional regulator with XRE-family HTH domain